MERPWTSEAGETCVTRWASLGGLERWQMSLPRSLAVSFLNYIIICDREWEHLWRSKGNLWELFSLCPWAPGMELVGRLGGSTFTCWAITGDTNQEAKKHRRKKTLDSLPSNIVNIKYLSREEKLQLCLGPPEWKYAGFTCGSRSPAMWWPFMPSSCFLEVKG